MTKTAWLTTLLVIIGAAPVSVHAQSAIRISAAALSRAADAEPVENAQVERASRALQAQLAAAPQLSLRESNGAAEALLKASAAGVKEGTPGNCLRVNLLRSAADVAMRASTTNAGTSDAAEPGATESQKYVRLVFRIARQPFARTCHVATADDQATAEKLARSAFAAANTEADRLLAGQELLSLARAVAKRGQSVAAARLLDAVFPLRNQPLPRTRNVVQLYAAFVQLSLVASETRIAQSFADPFAAADFSYLSSLTPTALRDHVGLVYTTALVMDRYGLAAQSRKTLASLRAALANHQAAPANFLSATSYSIGASFVCGGDWVSAAAYFDKAAEGEDVATRGLRLMSFVFLLSHSGADDTRVLQAVDDALPALKASHKQMPPDIRDFFGARVALVRAYRLLRLRRADEAVAAFHDALNDLPPLDAGNYEMALARILAGSELLAPAWREILAAETRVPKTIVVDGHAMSNGLWYEVQATKAQILWQQGKSNEARAVALEIARASPGGMGFADPRVFYMSFATLPLSLLADPVGSYEAHVRNFIDDAFGTVALYRLGAFTRPIAMSRSPLQESDRALLYSGIQAAAASDTSNIYAMRSALAAATPEQRALLGQLLANIQAEQRLRFNSRTTPLTSGGLPWRQALMFSSPCSEEFKSAWGGVMASYRSKLDDGEAPDVDMNEIMVERLELSKKFGAMGFRAPLGGLVPIGLSEIRPRTSDEAVVVYTVFPQYTILTLINRTGSPEFFPIEIGRAELMARVNHVLRSARAPLTPFDAAAASTLSKLLLQPLSGRLDGITKLAIVPASPLDGLPFAMLSAPGASGRDSYLIDRYAIAMFPGLDALKVAMSARPGRANRAAPFIGIGAPALNGSQATCGRALSDGLQITNGRADIDQLREMCPIDTTEDTLTALARTLNGSPNIGLFVREAATERAIRDMSADGTLKKAALIAFATHAITGAPAVGTKGYVPPGLVLTPPSEASKQDDGYLTAADIAQLDLGADWVLLTACNTAASDGTAGAQALSGVAQAFMSAGARAVLVSHWDVDRDAAISLLETTLRNYAGGAPKSEALRSATIAVRNDPSGRRSHPFYWAAFSNVGY